MFFKVLLSILLTANVVNCFVELNTLHLGDFIEFHSSLFRCKNSNSVIEELKRQYSDCLSKTVPNLSDGKGDEFGGFNTRVCSHQKAYIKCWEPVIKKSKECNSANGKGHPTSFSLVVKAICKNDRGKSFVDAFEKSVTATEAFIGDKDKDELCAAAGVTGEHWMVACKDLDIEARDVCKKHSELNKCMEKIMCKEIPTARLYLDVYSKAGEIQGCPSKNATSNTQHTRRPFYFVNHS